MGPTTAKWPLVWANVERDIKLPTRELTTCRPFSLLSSFLLIFFFSLSQCQLTKSKRRQRPKDRVKAIVSLSLWSALFYPRNRPRACPGSNWANDAIHVKYLAISPPVGDYSCPVGAQARGEITMRDSLPNKHNIDFIKSSQSGKCAALFSRLGRARARVRECSVTMTKEMRQPNAQLVQLNNISNFFFRSTVPMTTGELERIPDGQLLLPNDFSLRDARETRADVGSFFPPNPRSTFTLGQRSR